MYPYTKDAKIASVRGLVIAGKYVLERALAQGGMGSVWIARHRDLDIPVALKFMAPALVASADARSRFEREAKIAAKLDTLHVAQVYDCGLHEGTPYIAMELLKGEDLGSLLERERRLPIAAAARVVTQVCRALRRAHEMQLVHRDLKPANIFLSRKDDEEIVKVLDFGIAKAGSTGLAGPATQTGALIGSVHYMSPEQARRTKDVDHRSDLWSLGVVVFRALTGKLPFQGTEIGDVLVKICTEPAPLASTIAPDLTPEVDSFLLRALARSSEDRFQSAAEMAAAFAQIAKGSEAQETPKSPSDMEITGAPVLGENARVSGSTAMLPAVPPLPDSPTMEKTRPWVRPVAAQDDASIAPSQQTLGAPKGGRRRAGWLVAAGIALFASLIALSLRRGQFVSTPDSADTTAHAAATVMDSPPVKGPEPSSAPWEHDTAAPASGDAPPPTGNTASAQATSAPTALPSSSTRAAAAGTVKPPRTSPGAGAKQDPPSAATSAHRPSEERPIALP